MLREMKCPRDKHELVVRQNFSVKFYLCGSCHGLWFQLKDFGKIFSAGEEIKVPVSNKLSPSKFQAHCRKPSCPVDEKATMVKQNFKGIETYICLMHQGIWLDGGQLDLLISRYKAGSFSEVGLKERYTSVDLIADTAYAPDFFAALLEGISEAGETVLDFIVEAISSLS